ncbi:2-C-methyl-D-erythritol 4-phosphate cytidylyltransferase [Clostridium sp. YIM B02515]|uniref:2-C-methyl-D-erythritol 4-phosphate cytidylyltransferase n=1 Tax=Clostridium rhizosphaerae TaxID=2803861 RepID=A0ABS1TH84_9CLOT|nr:2-C-methyl-D-erythritol 4-phosphate cytidylyltransferase [Clostridium rhizosphaerae]MBL4938457.1 2-C-methyl-D-erythritol 4-phosphate cytidylyltransferase [Clostridium rhizosphaerae]
MSKVSAVIVAAGKGTRMKADINKQFLNIKGKPILYYTLKAFEACELVDEIVLVTAKDKKQYCMDEIVKKYGINKISAVVEGGKERQHSVFNGLKAVKKSDVVLIHDGARPFVDRSTIEEGIINAEKYGACTCGVKPKDTIKYVDQNGFSIDTLDRNSLFQVQTPQCFKYDLILACHEKGINEGITVTDDTSVVEHYGHKVYLYEGNYDNIKITTPEDLIIGERILEHLSVDVL